MSAAGLVEHIEKNRCKRIKNDELAAQREKRLAFARELQRRHFGDDPGLPTNASVSSTGMATLGSKRSYDFTPFLSTTRDGHAAAIPGLSALRPKADSTVRPNPVTFAMKKTEFPQINPEDPAPSASTPPGNAWTEKKNLFPDAPTAVRPTPETLKALTETPREPPPKWPPHDPRNPGWDPKKYWVPYSNKYKCPHDRCP